MRRADVILREFIESVVSKWVSSGNEVTQHLNPPGAIEDFLSPFGSGVLKQKRRDALQLGRNLAVGSGKQFADTSFRATRQTARADDEEIDLSAAVAGPLAA